MKKAIANTKVTVKLRKSEYHNEWYLIIESYPVFKPGNTKPSRIIEAINRTITTPIWDKSRTAPDHPPLKNVESQLYNSPIGLIFLFRS